MIIIRNIKLPLTFDFDNLKSKTANLLKINEKDILSVQLYKRSVDARKKANIHFNCSILAEINNEKKIIKLNKNTEKYELNEYIFPNSQNPTEKRPIIVGFGPAGMFAALTLAKAGQKPIVIEMGDDADTRKEKIDAFMSGKPLDTTSNVQFGEGGAGTFSDGKLNTGISDIRCRAVLKIFVENGAPQNILYDAKAHIGTDLLINVVKNIRKQIITLGGEIHFNCKLTGLTQENGKLKSVTVSECGDEKILLTDTLILAIGHSSRDTFRLLKNKNIEMKPKAFAIGARIEHLQSDINITQYGDNAVSNIIGAADYKLATHLEGGRGVYTFCMCPGGEVINASSETNGIVTNGMSYHKRNGVNSNSALLVGVNVEDFYNGDALDGVKFQEKIEQKAYTVGNGFPTCQTVGDFLNKVPSTECQKVKPTVKPNINYGSGDDILPKFVCDSMREGIVALEKFFKGFSNNEAILTFPETRSSSPVRIIRDELGQCNIRGIYPCGEGAGYAGGIMSAAVDGIKTAESVLKNNL